MKPIFNRAITVSLSAALMLGSVAGFLGPAFAQEESIEMYNRYQEEGSRAFNNSQQTQAIAAFEQALRYAPETSIPIVYNNLAACYMQRGNFYGNKGQFQEMLSDYRKAYFYLIYAWPEGAERKPVHERNIAAARENLNIGYRRLGINPLDRGAHLEMARQLRQRGGAYFMDAIVEYTQAFELDKQKQDFETAKAIADLYTVINLPEKSKKYYAIAANTPTSGDKPVSDDVLVQLGTSQYLTGEIDKAVQSFDKALAINPKNMGALNQLEKIWRDEIKFNPASVLGHANLGSVLQKKGQYDQAFQQYTAAEMFSEQNRNTPFEVKKQLRLNIGTLFQEKHDYQKALAAYETVLKVDPNHVDANFYKATLLEESGNIDDALAGYSKVLSLNPQHKGAQAKMLGLVKQQQDPARLAAGLKDYAARFANDAIVQAQIGEEFHNRKNLESAAYYYQRALQLNPNLAGTWANLGAVYEAQGNQDASLQAYQKAHALEPDNTTFKSLAENAESVLGYQAFDEAIKLQQQGKHADALAYFRKAMQTMDSGELHVAYAVSLHNTGQLDNAIAEYNKAIAKEAGNAEYHYYLGTAYHQKGDIPKALAAYKKALSLKPGYSEAREMVASIENDQNAADLDKALQAYDHKNYGQAMSLINAVLGRNSQNATAHYYKGLILEAQNKKPAAIQSYRDAIRYDADFADAYYALGVLLDSNSDTAGAKNAFQKYISLSGDRQDESVQYAKERVRSISP